MIVVVAVAGLAAALVLVATGCGASAAGIAAAPATTTTAKAGGAGPGSAAFRACLQKHGVTLTGRPPRNGTPPNGQRPPLTAKQRAAFKACGATRPNGPRAAAGTNVLKKYTQCLSKHGVTFGKTSSTSAKFKAADKACRKYLP